MGPARHNTPLLRGRHTPDIVDVLCRASRIPRSTSYINPDGLGALLLAEEALDTPCRIAPNHNLIPSPLPAPPPPALTTTKMTTLTRAAAEARVASWGFPTVFSWTDRRHAHPIPSLLPPLTRQPPPTNTPHSNAHYPPHSHRTLTTHLILRGSLTIRYPDGPAPDERRTFGPGDRVDVEAGRVHEVWMGKEGCTYVIGE